ncbi:MAG: tripartite tricarboxylate transporter substrate binding protein [Betaproteobacteria bacterium]|nr:MAG: tripartite tricarboxylate transporter substrate binding protein [Betaproteobacteria bacterium]
MSTKRYLACAAAAACMLAPSSGLAAEGADYPNRPVRWVVPFAPGASNDIIARLVAGKLTDSLGQQFVVDNRGGAGGMVGGEIVAKAAPDGYTLLSANPGPNVNNILLRKKAPYGFEDFTPIIFFGYAPLIIVANSKFPPNTAKELVDYARANPGKLSWASSGVGSSLHVGLELFRAATKIQLTHVPYKGTAPAFIDIISGQVNTMYTTSVSADAHLKSGRLKALGIAAKKRQSVLPNLPTLEEQGIKNAEAIVWFALAGPAKLPRAIVQKLNAEANRALALPDVKQRLDQLGLETGGGTPEEFAKFISSEADRLRALIKAGALTPE